MAEMRKRTSMSVLEMGRMLGLGKTESYWLIKKNYFKTILVGNTMRVMIDSFEEWYANQFKYQKVDGTPPGEELKKTTYSMEELGQRLGLKEATAYELVAKGHFDVVDGDRSKHLARGNGRCRSTRKEYEVSDLSASAGIQPDFG